MAVSFQQKYDIVYPAPPSLGAAAVTHILKKQAVEAMTNTANAILVESTGTTDHAGRLRYAEAALRNDATLTLRVLWTVLNDTNVTTAADPTAISDATVAGIVDGTPALFIATGLI